MLFTINVMTAALMWTGLSEWRTSFLARTGK